MINSIQPGNRSGAKSRRSGQPGKGRQQVRGLAVTEHLEARQLLSAAPPNLLANPHFTSGNTGFTSQYGHGTMPGQYVVAKNPTAVYPGTVSFGDHTTGAGLMLLANGATSGSAYVYREVVNVTKNTTYDFSGFAASFAQLGADHTDPSPARLSFYVNGEGIGTFSPSATDGKFARFSNLWNSGQSTTASIKIVDRNSAFTGNDFALDDLSFAASPNLLVNGDFSSGYIGFSSQYNKGTKPGDYVLAKTPTAVYPGTVSFGDHTTGTGLMQLANGATSGSKYVWQEVTSVMKNATYDFSGFAATFSQLGNDHTDPSPAKLGIYVNGVLIGDFKVSATDGKFGKFSAAWNSGNKTSATIKIVDLNHAVSGNDFALDDLAFNLT